MGKDYLGSNGIKGYAVFAHPERGTTEKYSAMKKFLGVSKIYRFAEPLKGLLTTFMGLSDECVKEYDSIKDTLNKIPPYNGTIRDYFIGIAATTRLIDPDFFAKRTVMEILKNQEDGVTITDWRFPNEYKVLSDEFGEENIITIRVHRDYDIPPNDVESEHSLDDIQPDFFLVPETDVFKIKPPQYTDQYRLVIPNE